MIEPGQESPRRDWEAEMNELYLANTTTTDVDTRMETGYDMQRIWMENVPWIYTANKAIMYAVNSKFGNAKVIGLDYYDGWKGLVEFLYVK
jgi:peptide/nickel transport system substrate-binding protein